MDRSRERRAATFGILVALACGHAVAAESGVAAFCAAHPDSDFPARAFYGSAYSETKVPKPVRKAGANAWRCMDGRVLVCHIGADGRPCQKLDAAAIAVETDQGLSAWPIRRRISCPWSWSVSRLPHGDARRGRPRPWKPRRWTSRGLSRAPGGLCPLEQRCSASPVDPWTTALRACSDKWKPVIGSKHPTKQRSGAPF